MCDSLSFVCYCCSYLFRKTIHTYIHTCMHACIHTYIFVGLILMLWHRETHINPQRNRQIIVDPAGIELTTSRLRQLRQLPVVQHVRFTPLKSRQKTQFQYMPVAARDNWQPVWNAQVSISTPVCVNFELRPGAGDIHICWFNFDALASVYDFAACHRLAPKDDAGVIVRFKDLQQRNTWLQNAKLLRSLKDNISISPDLPPILRPLKKELLHKRKNLTPNEKKGSIVRNLKQWPYVELKLINGPVIRPTAKPEDIVHSVLGFHPMVTFPEN